MDASGTRWARCVPFHEFNVRFRRCGAQWAHYVPHGSGGHRHAALSNSRGATSTPLTAWHPTAHSRRRSQGEGSRTARLHAGLRGGVKGRHEYEQRDRDQGKSGDRPSSLRPGSKSPIVGPSLPFQGRRSRFKAALQSPGLVPTTRTFVPCAVPAMVRMWRLRLELRPKQAEAMACTGLPQASRSYRAP